MNKTAVDPDNRFFTVTCRALSPEGTSIEDFARSIAEEQTVEIPHTLIPPRLLKNGIAGSVVDIAEQDGGWYGITLRYRCDSTGFSLPQFLNILYGNISLKQNILITGVSLPDECQKKFPGPRFGSAGIREKIGIFNRPLLCTALKPMGLSSQELAVIAGAAARGGIDLIKDDHGIADQSYHPFEERVNRVMEAVIEANLHTGTSTLYFPNLCGTMEEIDRQAAIAVKNGISGVLLSPHLLGIDAARHIAERYNLIIMAHPALTGSLFTSPHQGIVPELYLGTIFRMLGADISVFPSWGGRFPFSRKTCLAIAENLTTGSLPLRPAFPGPAGGITLDRFGEIAEGYGEKAVLLVGGALLGHSSDITKNAEHFLAALQGHFTETRSQPQMSFTSSCEVSPENNSCAPPASGVLSFDNFTWSDRVHEAYKQENGPGFTGITRTELLGKTGASTAFDLRYFEIEPGGYSSFEKHRHEHVIIGVRGNGILIKNRKQIPIHPHDIGYIGPMEPHQLQNLTDRPFGFYCIVDHHRDHPQPVDTDDFS